MVVFAVILLVLAVVLVVFGLVLYGNGVGVVPDDVGRESAATRKGLSRISSNDLFARMRTSFKGMTDQESSREQKMTATGAFCVMAGLILSVIALLAFIAGLL